MYLNSLYVKSYENGILVNDLISKIHLKAVENLKLKISLVNELSKIYSAQMTYFDPNRQEECQEIVKQLNDLDDDSVVHEYNNKISAIHLANIKITKEIAEIESTIPDQQIVSNFIAKRTKI